MTLKPDQFQFHCEKPEVGKARMDISCESSHGQTTQIRMDARLLIKFAEAADIDPTPIDVYPAGEADPVLFQCGDWKFVTMQLNGQPEPDAKKPSKPKAEAAA